MSWCCAGFSSLLVLLSACLYVLRYFGGRVVCYISFVTEINQLFSGSDYETAFLDMFFFLSLSLCLFPLAFIGFSFIISWIQIQTQICFPLYSLSPFLPTSFLSSKYVFQIPFSIKSAQKINTHGQTRPQVLLRSLWLDIIKNNYPWNYLVMLL